MENEPELNGGCEQGERKEQESEIFHENARAFYEWIKGAETKIAKEKGNATA